MTTEIEPSANEAAPHESVANGSNNENETATRGRDAIIKVPHTPAVEDDQSASSSTLTLAPVAMPTPKPAPTSASTPEGTSMNIKAPSETTKVGNGSGNGNCFDKPTVDETISNGSNGVSKKEIDNDDAKASGDPPPAPTPIAQNEDGDTDENKDDGKSKDDPSNLNPPTENGEPINSVTESNVDETITADTVSTTTLIMRTATTTTASSTTAEINGTEKECEEGKDTTCNVLKDEVIGPNTTNINPNGEEEENSKIPDALVDDRKEINFSVKHENDKDNSKPQESKKEEVDSDSVKGATQIQIETGIADKDTDTAVNKTSDADDIDIKINNDNKIDTETVHTTNDAKDKDNRGLLNISNQNNESESESESKVKAKSQNASDNDDELPSIVDDDDDINMNDANMNDIHMSDTDVIANLNANDSKKSDEVSLNDLITAKVQASRPEITRCSTVIGSHHDKNQSPTSPMALTGDDTSVHAKYLNGCVESVNSIQNENHPPPSPMGKNSNDEPITKQAHIQIQTQIQTCTEDAEVEMHIENSKSNHPVTNSNFMKDVDVEMHDTNLDTNQMEVGDSDGDDGDVQMHKMQNELSSNDVDVERDIINSISQQSDHAKSWHMEILFELFLRCDEKEVKHLAEQSELLITPFLDGNDKKRNCSTDSNCHPPSSRPRNRKRQRLEQYGNNGNLYNRFHVLPTKEPSIYPIFSEALKRYKVDDEYKNSQQPQHFSNSTSSSPSRTSTTNTITSDDNIYKRKSYTGRTKEQLERAVMNNFCDRILSQSRSLHSVYGTRLESSLKSHSHPSSSLDKNGAQVSGSYAIGNNGQTYKPITLMYNECSLAAIANWSLPPGSMTHTSVNNNTNETQSSSLLNPIAAAVAATAAATAKNSKMNNKTDTNATTESKRNFNLKRVNHVPVTSTMFRKCLACHKFGHYEIECEHLAQKKVKKAVKISKLLQDGVRVQNVLRDFASPFPISASSPSSPINHNTNTNNTDDLSDDSDDEAMYRLDVKQDLELLKEREMKICALKFSSVSPSNSEGDGPKKDENKNELSLASVLTATSNGIHNPLNLTKDGFGDNDIESNSEEPSYDGCEICCSKYNAEQLLVCDGCDRLYHKQCLDPPLEKVPEGDWFCPKCYSYDSDVSSIAEIEGLDEFVIEQRKLTKKEKITCRFEEDMRVGFQNGGWDTSVSVIPKDSSFLEVLNDPSYINDSDDDQSKGKGLDEIAFTAGELCFAKRTASTASLKAVYARDTFWPGMVVKVQDSNIAHDGTIQTRYIVKFFALPGSGRVRASHILPFFPNYEELGHSLLRRKNEPWYNNFRRALDEAISELGIHSLSHALAHAREITSSRISASNNKVPNKSPDTSLSKKLPEHAEITEIDNFVIVANPEPGSQAASKLSKTTTSSDLEEDETEKTEEAKQYAIEELIGGVVSFFLHGRNKLNVGVLSGVNKTRRKVLVHIISGLGQAIKAHDKEDQRYGNDISNNGMGAKDENLCDIYSCEIGASIWIPIESIFHLSTGMKKNDDYLCSSLVNDALSSIRKEMRASRDLENKIREDDMVKMDSSTKSDFDNSFIKSYTRSKSTTSNDIEGENDAFPYFSANGEAVSHTSYLSPVLTTSGEDNITTSLPRKLATKSTTATRIKDDEEDSVETKNCNGGVLTPRNFHRNKHGGKANTIFKIEMILDDRINSNGVKEYLINWKGFNDEENTWEMQKNISDTNILQSYLRKTQDGEGLTPSKILSNKRGGKATIFTIEMILDDRTNSNGVKEYLIKWKGFNDKENTWEIQKNILDTNILRAYLANKLLDKLRATEEADVEGTCTARSIKVIEAGIHLMNTTSTITTPKGKKNKCPFCLNDFLGCGLGPHIKMHAKSDNFELIKGMTKIADPDWYNACDEGKPP